MNIDFLKSSRAVALGRLSRLGKKTSLNEADQHTIKVSQEHVELCDKQIKKLEDTASS